MRCVTFTRVTYLRIRRRRLMENGGRIDILTKKNIRNGKLK